MAQIIKLKRSLVPGSKPTTSDLTAGELAINVYDGKVFLRKSGSVDEVQEIVTNNYVGNVNINGSLSASYLEGDGSRITGINIGSLSTVKRVFEGTTWVVTHNFNTESPLVQVYDQDDFQIIPQSIRINDANTVTISFATSISGSAVVANGGSIVSGSIDASDVLGFDNKVKTKLDAENVFSSSAQVIMSGDVTGTAAATVISNLDGGDI